MKQVDKDHYNYLQYESPEKFTSYYYQLKATLELHPESLLEIGVGNGIFLTLARRFGIETYGVDLDPDLAPSICANAARLPLADASIDVCAAFQTLEHIPFESLSQIARELNRVCRVGVVISLPDFGNASLTISAPYVRRIRIVLPRLIAWRKPHVFDGQHYWEINKLGYPRSRVLETFRNSGLLCVNSWLNPYNPYHRFFVFKKAGEHDTHTPDKTHD